MGSPMGMGMGPTSAEAYLRGPGSRVPGGQGGLPLSLNPNSFIMKLSNIMFLA